MSDQLEVLGLISPEKPQLLRELLDEVGRMDLTALVQEYSQKRRSNGCVVASKCCW